MALLIAALLLPAPSAPAQEIPSALPAIGRLLDIRDIKNITAARGDLVVTASHVYQSAGKFFDSDGERRFLPLNQVVRRQSVPVLFTYGLDDRWNVGTGVSVLNDVERKLSVLSFVPGATILGQPLPPGSVAQLETRGSGVGDVTFLVQHSPDWLGDEASALLSFEAIAPTARSDPSGPLDSPVGQGFWSYRGSMSAVRDAFPFVYFGKLAYERNAEDSGLSAAGTAFTFDPGDGIDVTAGASYAIGEDFSLLALLAGSWRDAGSRSDLSGPTPFTRTLDARPGYTLRLGELVLTQQLSIPVAGRNSLSTEGVLTTLEYRF